MKCDCLLDDEESDYTQSKSSSEQTQTNDYKETVVEDNQDNESKCFIEYVNYMLIMNIIKYWTPQGSDVLSNIYIYSNNKSVSVQLL